MVLPSNAVPPNETWFAREIAALREASRTGLASVASSFRSTVSDLQAQQAELATQQGLLAAAIARQTEMITAHVESWTVAYNTTLAAQRTLTKPSWAAGCFIDGGGAITNITVTGGGLDFVLVPSASPVTAWAENYCLDWWTDLDYDPQINSWTQYIDMSASPTLYLRPARYDLASDATAGSMTITANLRITWI
ncbi:MAG: hypothetical protein QM804_10365 [Propionicimonas sp.]